MAFHDSRRDEDFRARRRYERALRKASGQLAKARARAGGRAWRIPSIDLVLALRRAGERAAGGRV